ACDRAADPQRVAVGRVEREARAVDEHVDLLDLHGDAVDHVRDRVRAARVGGDRQGGGEGVHLDFRAHHHAVTGRLVGGVGGVVLEVEGAGLHGVDDRQPEGGAGVFFGDVDAPAPDAHGV